MNEIEQKNEDMPVTIFNREGGPKPIGVVDRPFVEFDQQGIRERLKEAGEILLKKHGNDVFQNELGRQLKFDFIKMGSKPGSYVFIADSDVTIAMMNEEGKNLLVEVRRPGMPYQRGRIETKNQLGESLGFKALLEG